jgi:uncharacterized caspase-like protein
VEQTVNPAPAAPVTIGPAGRPPISRPFGNERRVALVIGNSAYPGAARLANPANDADDMTAALRGVGFDVVEGRDLTLQGFADMIDTFREKAKGADVALFYYAGHGMQFEDQNWLMPIDTQVTNAFYARRFNVKVSDVVAEVEAEARTTLIFLDACRDNPLDRELKEHLRTEGRGFDETRGLGRIEVKAPQTMVVYATRPNSVAADGTGRNSPFTAAFLQHINEPGVEIETLMKRVSATVGERTRGKQQPERLSRLEQEFYFVPAR